MEAAVRLPWPVISRNGSGYHLVFSQARPGPHRLGELLDLSRLLERESHGNPHHRKVCFRGTCTWNGLASDVAPRAALAHALDLRQITRHPACDSGNESRCTRRCSRRPTGCAARRERMVWQEVEFSGAQERSCSISVEMLETETSEST